MFIITFRETSRTVLLLILGQWALSFLASDSFASGHIRKSAGRFVLRSDNNVRVRAVVRREHPKWRYFFLHQLSFSIQFVFTTTLVMIDYLTFFFFV